MASTIRDVAREAGVGVGTVSRVLGGRGPVAPETRARVERAIAALDYRPNPAARALSRRRTATIEVAVPLLTNHAFVEIVRGIEEALGETGLSLVIRTVDRADDRDRVLRQLAEPGRADGGLVVALDPTPALVERADRLPIVLLDAVDPRFASVVIDHRGAARTAVARLVGAGRRRIALLDEEGDGFAAQARDAREAGYCEALIRAGLGVDPALIARDAATPDGGARAALALLDLGQPPDAIFAGSDVQAVGALQAARRRGFRCPADLAIIGYGDIAMSRYIGLTTVRLPLRALGEEGTALLLALLAGEPAPSASLVLDAPLIERRTVVKSGEAPFAPFDGGGDDDDATAAAS